MCHHMMRFDTETARHQGRRDVVYPMTVLPLAMA